MTTKLVDPGDEEDDDKFDHDGGAPYPGDPNDIYYDTDGNQHEVGHE